MEKKSKEVKTRTSPIDIVFLISAQLEIPDIENMKAIQEEDTPRQANAQKLRKLVIYEREDA